MHDDFFHINLLQKEVDKYFNRIILTFSKPYRLVGVLSLSSSHKISSCTHNLCWLVAGLLSLAWQNITVALIPEVVLSQGHHVWIAVVHAVGGSEDIAAVDERPSACKKNPPFFTLLFLYPRSAMNGSSDSPAVALTPLGTMMKGDSGLEKCKHPMS